VADCLVLEAVTMSAGFKNFGFQIACSSRLEWHMFYLMGYEFASLALTHPTDSYILWIAARSFLSCGMTKERLLTKAMQKR
jgi:hypothetical protein